VFSSQFQKKVRRKGVLVKRGVSLTISEKSEEENKTKGVTEKGCFPHKFRKK